MLRWPDQKQVHSAVVEWVRALIEKDERVSRAGYAGSYARGNWGVGSDVDIVILLSRTDDAFIERACRFDATDLPVPADVLVYTESEWSHMTARGADFRPVEWIT